MAEGFRIFPLPHATTAAMALDQVVARLSRQATVDGVVFVGSTGQGTLTPFSDYDLLVILSDMPVPLHVGITYIDHRLTDLLFATTAQVQRILATTVAIEGAVWEGRIVRWLVAGKVVFDRHGHLSQAQEKVRSGNWIRPLEDIDAYGAWIGVNYNLLHTRRLLHSDDPVYRHAAELRISLYGFRDVMFSYFSIRKLLWEGDKAAIRYLMTHDPLFFALLQGFMRESDLDRKFAAYEQVATATLAPIGSLWDGEPMVVWSDASPPSWATMAQSLAFWEDLMAGDDT